MKKFTLFYRYRFLRVWLLAIAYQTEQLFSQQNSPDIHWYSSTPPIEQNLPPFYDDNAIQDEQYNSWQIANNPSLSHFDSSTYYPTDSHSSLPIESHHSQWSGYSHNEWQNSDSFSSNDQPEEPFPSTTEPQDGQWSSYSNNEWQNSDSFSNNDQPEEPFPSTPESQDGQWPFYSNQNEKKQSLSSFNAKDTPFANGKDINDPDSCLNQPLNNLSQTSSLTSSFSEYSKAENQNVTIFDMSNNLQTDKNQHPLTKEGQATSYSFENESTTSTSSTSQISAILPGQDRSLSPLKVSRSEEKKETEEDVSQGKSTLKIIKKLPESDSSTGLKEPLDSSESVGAKQDIADSSKEIPASLKNQPVDALSLELIAQTISASTTTPPLAIPQPVNPSNPAITPPVSPRSPTIITPASSSESAATAQNQKSIKEISINFNNVAMIEYIRFISRISGKNFIFDDEDLQFNVTIVSEEPTNVENLMAALLQELKIRDLSLLEQGNNIIIHRNPRIRAPAHIVVDGTDLEAIHNSELVTRVFRLNTLDPMKASEIIRPLLSDDALVEVLRDTNNLIITDLVTNVNKIAQLIRNLDAPNSGIAIGQYVVRNAFVASLVDLATKILQPIAQGNPFVLVPHPVSNSIFIVSNSFIVEKALAILQNLDMNEGRTKIFSLETLYPSYNANGDRPGNRKGAFGQGTEAEEGSYSGSGPGSNGRSGNGTDQDQAETLGNFPSGGIGSEGRNAPHIGNAASYPFNPGILESEGRINPVGEAPAYPFTPGGLAVEGRPSAIFDESRDFLPGSIGASTRWSNELPVGHIERTLFFIHKLRYRRGDQIELALRKIAASLQLMGTANVDLISAINSIQWIEASNSLIFTGTAVSLEKVRELILEIDNPLRQVFIEMLILNTSINDSLTYGVDWIDRFGGGNTTGEEGFIGLSTLANVAETLPGVLPIASGLVNPTIGGFNAAIIGTHLTHNGTRFNTIGALVRAIHDDTKTDIIMNPKIITEDNNTAEIFVGGTDRYKTQSITNELGTLVTNNFQFIDVGTTLRVTPLIGNNGIITLDIIQETTTGDASANATPNQQVVDVNLVPVLSKTRTVTKVHVPDGFFVVLSGMIQDTEIRSASRIPCLGGIPIIGAFGKRQTNVDSKTNLMIFIRPLIINNEEEYEDVTKRQQDVFREKTKFRRSWNYEIDEALNFGNIRPTDRDEIGCDQK